MNLSNNENDVAAVAAADADGGKYNFGRDLSKMPKVTRNNSKGCCLLLLKNISKLVLQWLLCYSVGVSI